jgi:hypothetical protein
MFIKKDAKLIVDLVKLYLPKKLAENEDLIIAGGFALNAYMVSEALLGLRGSPSFHLIAQNLLFNPVVPFSDVDLWIKKDCQDEMLLTLFRAQKDGDIKRDTTFVGDGESLFLQRSSDWANTYSFSGKGSKVKLKHIQCIVKKQDSVESLLSSFDLGICSVAIHKGEFIIHPSFMESLNSKQLTINNASLMRKSLPSKVYQALRHFKYFEKTKFEFSKELYQKTLEVMSDSNTYWQECKKLGVISQWGGTTAGVKVKITTSDNYEQEVVTKESTNSMIKRLAVYFAEMQKMSHWDVSHALFVGDSDLFPVKSIIEKKLAEANKNSRSDNAPDILDELIF